MREICTSGSVRDGDGNAPIYSAWGAAQRGQIAAERRGRVERREIAEEGQLAGLESGLQTVEKEPAEELLEDRHGQEKPGTAGCPAAAVERRSATGDDAMQMRMVAPTPTIP
jgi:hypothetical protein